MDALKEWDMCFQIWLGMWEIPQIEEKITQDEFSGNYIFISIFAYLNNT